MESGKVAGLALDALGALQHGIAVTYVEYEFRPDKRLGLLTPWRPMTVEVVEEISGDNRATLRLDSEDPDADPELLLGTAATLVMRRPNLYERRFCGIVRSVTILGQTGRQHTACEVELVPAFACLDERIDRRHFQGMTVPEIVKEVLDEGLTPLGRQADFKLSRTGEKPGSRDAFAAREWCVQYGESCFAFVRRLLAEEGIAYYFDHAGDVERMIITDNPFAFPEAKTPIDLIETAGVVPSTEAITSFRLTRARVPGKVTLRASELTRRVIAVDANRTQPRDEKAKGEPGYAEIYDGAANFVPHDYDRGKGVYRHDNLESQALLRLEEVVQRERQAAGAGFVVGFQAGIVVWLDVPSGHAGKFLLTKIVHRGQDHRWGAQPGGAPNTAHHPASTTSASPASSAALSPAASPSPKAASSAVQPQGFANYGNTFECQPAAPLVFRPRRLPKPTPRAFDMAEVVTDGDEEITTDKHGRIKVRFVWDRTEAPPSEKDSCWVPVLMGWAGPGYGLQITPRRGMVVAISYIDGDIDRPVVTGCLNAGPNYLPAETPRHKSQVVLRTRSLRGGGDGYEHHNEILLDDAAKNELMSLHAGWDWKRKVRNNDVTEIDGSETRTVIGRQRVHVKGELLDHEADKDAKETIHGARTRQVDKDEKVTINGNQTVTLTKGGRKVEIAGKATVIAHADREVQVEGNELHHVHHERTEVVDDKLVIRQGDTTVTLTEGTVDVHAAASLKLHHAGATVEIDEDGNVTVSTDKELKLIGDGAAITLGDGKAALSAESEMTLTVGGSAVKLDAGGVTTSGGNITSTANGMHQTTGTIVSQNC